MRVQPIAILAVAIAAAHGCRAADETAGGAPSSSIAGSGGASGGCTSCVKDADCPAGSRCGQFAGDAFCAPECASSACGADAACNPVNTAEGAQALLCLPKSGPCGVATTSGPGTTSSGGGTCGSLDGPDVKSCCTSCGKSGKPCDQQNGCYGGWWCNHDTCSCQKAPDPSSCGPSSSPASSSVSTVASSGAGGSSGIGPNGGKLDALTFAVVGDTRPPSEDDLAGYPTAVIGKIWQDVEAASPRPAFAVTTGDYQFSNPFKNGAAAKQFDLYLGARAVFANEVFPAMGNHECTGATASNCGSGNKDGVTNNYAAYLQKMLAPAGLSKPYYVVAINHSGGSWSSKFVFVAANAWDAAQAAWLDAALAVPTTYTFVVRHECPIAVEAPGVKPSDAIVAQHPYTLLICGHNHTFEYLPSSRLVVVGNGGAPLSGAVNYGYVIARQRADGAVEFKEYDYATNAQQYAFAIKADGTPTK